MAEVLHYQNKMKISIMISIGFASSLLNVFEADNSSIPYYFNSLLLQHCA